jgi:protein SCO1
MRDGTATATGRLGALLLAAGLVALLAGCGGGRTVTPPPTPSPSPSPAASPSPEGAATAGEPGGSDPADAFTDLVAAGGSPFSLADTAGHWRLVFFGYTHCPDVCPETIGVLMQVMAERPETRVIFVSIDPARDTPGSLASWTRYLPEGLSGVTGSPSAVRHAADAFGVTYARVDTSSKAGYSMAHTADQFLLDPDGQLRLTYPFGTLAETIIADIERLESAGQETT